MAPVFYFPLLGTPTAEGNQLWFYEAGLDVPLDVWTDSDLTIPWAQPIVFNAAAEADGPIYVSDSPSYKVVYKDANGVAIAGYPVDFVAPSTIINVTTVATTVLTNAQIKTLPTTPVTLVAAPASGLRIKLLAASAKSVIVSNYTNIDATYSDIDLAYSASGPLLAIPIFDDPTAVSTGLTGLLASGAGTFLADFVVPFSDLATYWPAVTAQTSSSESALPLLLKGDNNGSGALTGGNAGNSLTITVYYALESVL
jgi:hypothetical protein